MDKVTIYKHVYKNPTGEEFTEVYKSFDEYQPGHRHDLDHHKQNGLQILSALSPYCDPCYNLDISKKYYVPVSLFYDNLSIAKRDENEE